MLRVSELLEMESFLGIATLVAGNEGLSNEIRYITVMEAPDFPNWVNGGEFVLTTFFSVKDDIDQQIGIICGLSEHRVAGLAIKIDRYISAIHPLVIQAAEKMKLPLFAVTREAKFRDIIQNISQVLIPRQAGSPVETEQFYDMIMKLVLKGESPDILCEQTENYVGYTCAILSPGRERIAGAIKRNGILQYHYNGEDGDTEIDCLLDQFAIKDKLLDGPSEYRFGSYVVVGCCVKGELISLLLFSGVTNWGDRESVIAKRAAYAIGYRFLEEHIQKNVEERTLSSFIDEIVFKEIDPKLFASRAHFFGWTIHDCFQAVVVRHVGKESLSTNAFHLLTDWWIRHMRRIFPSVLAVTKQDELIVMISIPAHSKLNDIGFHKEQMNGMLSLLFYHSQMANQIHIGVGPVYNEPSLLQKSYLQARAIVDFTAKRKGMLWYVTDHLLELFLLESKDQTEYKLILNTLREPIIAYDSENGTDLVKTMQAFLRHDSLEEAAESLYVHQNTLRNRLNKVTEITGVNPNKTSGRMMYFIALIENI